MPAIHGEIAPAAVDLKAIKAWEPDEWRSWLRRITDKQVGVIPVLGPDLVKVQTPAGVVPLTLHLARQLAKRLKINLPAVHDPTPLDTVATKYHGTRAQLTEELWELASQENMPTPEPLRQLAEIEDFALFVTTAFDPLLARALKEVRGKPPHTLTYSGAEKPDLIDDLVSLRQAEECVICYLLGEGSNVVGSWAITEQDRLEFHHKLQAPTRQPHTLFSELQKRHLLLLGSGHPDWLARFFLRNLRGDNWQIRSSMELVVDESVLSDNSLRLFLQRYSPQTRLHPTGNALQFIADLHKQYTSIRPGRARALDALPKNYRPPPLEAPAHAAFISYAREDVAAARLLYMALWEAGVPAWLDEERLETGDNYLNKILTAIDQSRAFVPVVSRSAADPKPRFFRKEWERGAERMTFYLPGRFVFPVFVDDLPMAEAPIDDRFLKCHIVRLTFSRETGCFADPETVDSWAATIERKLNNNG